MITMMIPFLTVTNLSPELPTPQDQDQGSADLSRHLPLLEALFLAHNFGDGDDKKGEKAKVDISTFDEFKGREEGEGGEFEII
jgi:hypothetical protein